jgi:hypothetical protein
LSGAVNLSGNPNDSGKSDLSQVPFRAETVHPMAKAWLERTALFDFHHGCINEIEHSAGWPS